jgi:hypothetical protein
VVTLVVGSLCALVFLHGTREKLRRKARRASDKGAVPRGHLDSLNDTVDSTPYRRWHEWLAIVDFWLVAVIYMCSRVVVNISQVCIVFLPR